MDIINPDNVCVFKIHVYIYKDGDPFFFQKLLHDLYIWQCHIATGKKVPFMNMRMAILKC
jgi:hypothetical protein